MTVESAVYINGLNATLPTGSDQKAEGDDHIRLLKTTVKASFPNVTGAVTASHTELGYVTGVTSAIQTQLNAKASASGNVATATALQTPRAINGVNFDGSAPITVPAAAGTLTGSTLAAGVTGSSLTSVGSGCTDGTNELGYKGMPRVGLGANDTALVANRGKSHAGAFTTFTIPNATFSAGDFFTVYNDQSIAASIVQGTSLTLRLAGTTSTGSRAIAGRGFASIYFNSSSEAIISGPGVS